MPENPFEFMVDNIQTLKILGSNLYQTEVFNGMIVNYQSKTNIKCVKQCKVLMLTTNVGLREMDVTQNVIFNSANEMINFSNGEEDIIEGSIKHIYDLGVRLLILNNKPTNLE